MSSVLLPLVQLFATAASLAMVASPLADIKQMIASKSVGELSHLPYLMMFSSSCSWSGYAWHISNLVPIGITNAINCIISGYILLKYYTLCSANKKMKVQLHVTVVSFIVLSFFYYAVSNGEPEFVRSRLGTFSSMMTCICFVSPLSTMKQVISTKSAASISFNLANAGLANGCLWILYGILVADPFMIGPNLLCVASSGLQLLLFNLYSDSRLKKTDSPTRGGGNNNNTASSGLLLPQ